MESSEILGAAALVLLLLAVTVLVVGPAIWGLVDASRYSEAAWAATGRKKSHWIAAFAIGIWAWFVGIPAAILYLRQVRPELQKAAPEILETGASKSPRSRRVWVIGGIVVGGLWLFGAWAYVTHGNDEFFHPKLAREATSVCTDAKSALANLPPLPDSPTFDQRAESVERSATILETMVANLRSLEVPGENDAYDEWLDHWREFIDAGRSYADAIRTGDPAVYEPAGNAGDRPATEVNTIARANDMEACVF